MPRACCTWRAEDGCFQDLSFLLAFGQFWDISLGWYSLLFALSFLGSGALCYWAYETVVQSMKQFGALNNVFLDFGWWLWCLEYYTHKDRVHLLRLYNSIVSCW